MINKNFLEEHLGQLYPATVTAVQQQPSAPTQLPSIPPPSIPASVQAGISAAASRTPDMAGPQPTGRNSSSFKERSFEPAARVPTGLTGPSGGEDRTSSPFARESFQEAAAAAAASSAAAVTEEVAPVPASTATAQQRQYVEQLYEAAVIADQNAKLSVFTTRPAGEMLIRLVRYR